MAKTKKSLRNALNSHQVKMFQQKQFKVVEAHKKAGLKNDLAKGKDRVTRKSVIPYNAQDAVLLIGEGDFSFARSLITETSKGSGRVNRPQLNPINVTATALDSEATCYDKYPWARHTVQELRKCGMEILFGIDATKLGDIKHLRNKRYDRVVFNFPHTGKGIADQDRNIRSNQELLQRFFKAAPAVLKEGSSNASRITAKKTKRKSKVGPDGDESLSYDEAESERENSDQDMELYDITRGVNWETEMSSKLRGTLLVTLRDTSPYTLWDMPKLAKKPQDDGPQYKQLRSFVFRLEDYPGYSHMRTAGHRGEKEISVLKEKDGVTDARTWEFELTGR